VRQTYFDTPTLLNFICQLGLKQRVMQISLNKVPIQNKLAMSGVTY